MILYYLFYVVFSIYYGLEWLIKALWTHKTNIVVGVLAFNLAGIIHELGHGLGNVLSGGNFGLACSACTGDHLIIGGYGLHGLYMGVIPVFSVQFQELGNRLAMLLAGPWIVILLGWIAAIWFNRRALVRRYGAFGNTLWKWGAAGIVYGFMLRAWFDSVYVLPIDVFPDQPVHGDGIAIYYLFQELGWHRYDPISIFGVESQVMFNPGYLVGAVAIIGTLYGSYRLLRCTQTLCGCRL